MGHQNDVEQPPVLGGPLDKNKNPAFDGEQIAAVTRVLLRPRDDKGVVRVCIITSPRCRAVARPVRGGVALHQCAAVLRRPNRPDRDCTGPANRTHMRDARPPNVPQRHVLMKASWRSSAGAGSGVACWPWWPSRSSLRSRCEFSGSSKRCPFQLVTNRPLTMLAAVTVGPSCGAAGKHVVKLWPKSCQQLQVRRRLGLAFLSCSAGLPLCSATLVCHAHPSTFTSHLAPLTLHQVVHCKVGSRHCPCAQRVVAL